MKENKGVLVTIIVLLIIFFPLTILGFIENQKIENNSEHKLYYKGYLWFYDNDELIGKYQCNNLDCNLASVTITDESYNKKFYRGDLEDAILPINNKYAFIKDGTDIILYDIKTKGNLAKYKSVNNYNTKIVGDSFILEQENGKFGVLKFINGLESVIPFTYDFIGLANNLTADNELIANYFLVKQDDFWFLIDSKNNIISKKYQEEIIDYRIFDEYMAIITEQKIDIYELEDNVLKYSKNIDTDYSVLEFKVKDNAIEITKDSKDKEIIEINEDF